MSGACAVCAECADTAGILWQCGAFQLRHAAAPYGVAGWLVLQTHAHTPGPAAFDDAQAAALGPALRAASAALQAALGPAGCQRVYVAALGEAHHHFHMHLVPRMADGPAGWSVFGQQADAVAGRAPPVDAAAVAAVSARVAAAMAGVRVD